MNETRYVILQLPPIPSLLAILYASRGATCGPLPEFSLLNIVEEPQCPKKITGLVTMASRAMHD